MLVYPETGNGFPVHRRFFRIVLVGTHEEGSCRDPSHAVGGLVIRTRRHDSGIAQVPRCAIGSELHHRLVSFVPWPTRCLEKSLLLAGQAIAKHFALELQLKSSGKFLGGLCAGSRGRCRSLETFHGSCYVDSFGSPTRVDLHLLAHVRSEVSHGAAKLERPAVVGF